MDRQETYEKIEAYLNGELQGKELKDFQTQLQVDEELVAQVALFKGMDKALGEKDVFNFQQLVQEEGESFLKEQQQETPVVKLKSNAKRYLAMAASFLLLVAAFLFWKSQSNTLLGGDELFAQHFKTYPLNPDSRSDDNVATAYETGIAAYQSKDYITAAATLGDLATAFPEDMVLAFSLAQSLLNQDPPAFDLAETEFQKIILEGNSIYVPQSKWYLSLILLKKGRMEEAKKYLIDLSKATGPLAVQANTLLKQI